MLICTLTCVLGLTGCGEEKQPTAYEQKKLEMATRMAVEVYVPMIQEYAEKGFDFSEYTKEEIEDFVKAEADTTNDLVEATGFVGAITSFQSSKDVVGDVTLGDATAKIDGDDIIVNIEVKGSKKDADIEVVVSNDRFAVLKSAGLNPKADLKDKMVKASLNTVIGMGTVFIVLILISFLISLFKYIPPIVEAISKKINGVKEAIAGIFKKNKKKQEDKEESLENTIQQIVEKEESGNDLSDDLELVAVISAAIAAYEGAQGADGYVVRSIRKVNRRA